MNARLVYIDQGHLDDTPDVRRLRARALRGEFIAPMSAVHIIETVRAWPERRSPVAAALGDLSRGYVVLTEYAVALEEARRAGDAESRERVREAALCTNVWELALGDPVSRFEWWKRRTFPLSVGRFVGALAAVGETKEADAIARQHLAAGRVRVNTSRPLPSLRSMLDKYPIPSAHVADDRLRDVFRTLATRHALQAAIWKARPSGMEENDVLDIFFLAVALPYFDAVCIDSKMWARVEEARATVGVKWARSFRRLPDLLAWLDARVPNQVSC